MQGGHRPLGYYTHLSVTYFLSLSLAQVLDSPLVRGGLFNVSALPTPQLLTPHAYLLTPNFSLLLPARKAKRLAMSIWRAVIIYFFRFFRSRMPRAEIPLAHTPGRMDTPV